MSEINENTPVEEDLNDVVEEEIDDAEVMQVPIDDTLTVSGEAADAKAVGDALALKADKSELQNQVNVNGQEPDNQGLIILLAAHIPVTDAPGASSVAQVLSALGSRTGADIPLDGTSGETIADALSGVTARTADTIKMSSAADAKTVAQTIAILQEAIKGNADAIILLDQKTGSTIKLDATGDTTIAQALGALSVAMVKSVNLEGPDADGNVTITVVPFAENLTTEDTKQESGTFIRRTSAGSASITDGNAWLNRMLGNSRHDGYVPEALTLNVLPATRPTPAGITAELDAETFEAAVESAGTYTLTYENGEWSTTPATWGVTVSGTPESGDTITITWDGENDPEMNVSCPRTPEAAITATIDRDVFVGVVTESGTINLYYTTEWSEDPEDYGITVTGTPIAGDHIQVVYVKEVRGTIIQAQPTAIVGTGWNLFERTKGHAHVVRYSDEYGYKIGGTWSGVSFKETLDSAAVEIVPDAGGLFNVPADGYVIVTGASTDTYILTTWSDWTDGPAGGFKSYTESRCSLQVIMEECFPYGLMKVGTVQDEIDRNAQTATSWVQRIVYSEEARAAAEGSGLQYDFDENYIYIERDDPIVTHIELAGEYAISEHGLEYIDGTALPIYCEILYGENLRDKLRRDVITSIDGNRPDASGAAQSEKFGLYLDADGYLCQHIVGDA